MTLNEVKYSVLKKTDEKKIFPKVVDTPRRRKQIKSVLNRAKLIINAPIYPKGKEIIMS